MQRWLTVVLLAATLLTLSDAALSGTGRIGKGARGRPHMANTPAETPWFGGLLMIYHASNWQ